jgi:tetratricopeptide (TPR) repeat protein
MSIDLKGYSIFIASPGGLDKERESFRKVLNDYNDADAVARGVTFLPVGWELTLGGIGRPQALINEDLHKCDYLVLVLWDRWGTPPSNSSDGYSSGTEEEFEEALKCLASSDFPMKQIVVFFKALEERQLSDPGDQLKKVLEFKEKLEKDKPLYFDTYDVLEDFEKKLRQYLARWVRDHEDGGDSNESSAPPEPPTTDKVPELSKETDENPLSVGPSSNVQSDGDLVKVAEMLATENKYTEAELLFANIVARSTDLNAIVSYGKFLLQQGRLDQAETKLNSVIDLAESEKDALPKGQALHLLGDLYFGQQRLKRAERLYQQSLAIFEQIDNNEGAAEVYTKLGDFYEARKNYDMAEQMELRSLEIFEQLRNEKGMADAFSKLADIYLVLERYDEAEETNNKSAAIKERLGINEGLADIYSNLGNVYQIQGNLDKAEKEYLLSLTAFQAQSDSEGVGDVSNSLGDVYLAKKDFSKAEEYYLQSLRIFEEFGNDQGTADIYKTLGNLYLTLKDRGRADSFYRRSLAIFEQLGDKTGMADVYNKLSEVYEGDRAKTMLQKSEELLNELKTEG